MTELERQEQLVAQAKERLFKERTVAAIRRMLLPSPVPPNEPITVEVEKDSDDLVVYITQQSEPGAPDDIIAVCGEEALINLLAQLTDALCPKRKV